MINQEKISGTQVFMLLFLLVMSTVVLFVPGITVPKAKESAWLVPLFSASIGFISLWTVFRLGKRFPGQTLLEYSKHILGKFMGKLVALIFITFLLVTNILVIREFAEFTETTVVRLTPKYVIIFALVLVCSYGSIKGIEVIARAGQFIFPLFIFSLLFILVLSVLEFDLDKLKPFLETGIVPLLIASKTPASWYGEVVILAMLLPYTNKPREVMKKGSLALVSIAVSLSITNLVTIGVFGPELSGTYQFPFWSLVRYIELGSYLQRVESVVVVLWITGIVFKATLLNWLICSGTQQVFGIKKIAMVFSVMAVVQILAAWFAFDNAVELSMVLDKYWPFFGLSIECGLPLFLLFVAYLRKKKLKGGSN